MTQTTQQQTSSEVQGVGNQVNKEALYGNWYAWREDQRKFARDLARMSMDLPGNEEVDLRRQAFTDQSKTSVGIGWKELLTGGSLTMGLVLGALYLWQGKVPDQPIVVPSSPEKTEVEVEDKEAKFKVLHYNSKGEIIDIPRKNGEKEGG